MYYFKPIFQEITTLSLFSQNDIQIAIPIIGNDYNELTEAEVIIIVPHEETETARRGNGLFSTPSPRRRKTRALHSRPAPPWGRRGLRR